MCDCVYQTELVCERPRSVPMGVYPVGENACAVLCSACTHLFPCAQRNPTDSLPSTSSFQGLSLSTLAGLHPHSS